MAAIVAKTVMHTKIHPSGVLTGVDSLCTKVKRERDVADNRRAQFQADQIQFQGSPGEPRMPAFMGQKISIKLTSNILRCYQT